MSLFGNLGKSATKFMQSTKMSRISSKELGVAGGVIGSGMFLKSLRNSLSDGTEITNPIFQKHTVKGYGKRGIDARSTNASGDMAFGLHNNRRNIN